MKPIYIELEDYGNFLLLRNTIFQLRKYIKLNLRIFLNFKVKFMQFC